MENKSVRTGASAIARLNGAVAAALSRAGVAPGDLLLAAVSGGPDSVALLHALAALRTRFAYRLSAIHLNHGLRGEESERDENFARGLCRAIGVEFISGRADGLRADSPNLEERAREARLRFFDERAGALGARFIVLGHHADDQAETALMRLLRGSGVAGLAAMAEAGPGRLLRPMLRLRRSEILACLAALGAKYVIDSSNNSRSIPRNRIRYELMPLIEREYAPGFSRRLAALASEMRELDDFIASRARLELAPRIAPGNRLNLTGLPRMEPVILRAMMREFIRVGLGGLRRIGRVHVETAAGVCVGDVPSAIAILPGGWRLRREYGEAVLEPAASESRPEFAIELGLDGVTIIEPAGFVFEARTMALDKRRHDAQQWRGGAPMEAFFDAERLGDGLMVRNYRKGDRIRPLGIAGTRKLHDVFVDRKAPREGRARWPLVVAGDEIVWVPGLVRSRIAAVMDRSEKVLHLRARPLAEGRNPALLVN